MLQTQPTRPHRFPIPLCLAAGRKKVRVARNVAERPSRLTIFSNGEQFFCSTEHSQPGIPRGFIARSVVLPHSTRGRCGGTIRTRTELLDADYENQREIDNPLSIYQA
jgi:hypothetical protein